MIKRLGMKNLGPCEKMPVIEFGKRLNIFTGDNGLGKSFILDLAWWSLTRRWPAEINPRLTGGSMAVPNGSGDARIDFSVTGATGTYEYSASFNREAQVWTGKQGRPINPGLVIYAMVDGSFAVWDPHRNYWKNVAAEDQKERQPAYVFSPREVWDGMRNGDSVLCNGLLLDWASWQRENGRPFKTLLAVLDTLVGDDAGRIEPGELRRVSLDDARMYPTLKMPYGLEVPLNQCSAGLKRIFALAYLLVWTWEEHIAAGELIGKEPTAQITFLMDEIEAHLHPRWQRMIVSAFLNVMTALATDASVQLIAATHSPLLLASIEPIFDVEKDAWYDFDLEAPEPGAVPKVVLNRREFRPQGDASAWLRSEAFDLKYACSREAEIALLDAEAFMVSESNDRGRAREIHEVLRKVLPETDPFWLRWRFVSEKKGWLA